MAQLATVLRVAIAVNAGDPGAFDLASAMLEDLTVDPRFLNDEQHALWGIAQLQHGNVTGAVETLRTAHGAARNRGPKAAADVALAAALVAAGEPAEALELCAEAQDLVVTFVDRYRLELARGFALHRIGDTTDARAALDRAAAIVDATSSPLDQFVVRLARAALDREAPADEQRSIGWETTFALMAGTPG
jgi:tetratricopeptide (TPR) repeat protein